MLDLKEAAQLFEKMCDSCHDCANCPMQDCTTDGLRCAGWVIEHPVEAEKILVKWARHNISNWREPMPDPREEACLTPLGRELMQYETANERLNSIHDLLVDWDGYRTIRGMGELIDEATIWAREPCMKECTLIDEVSQATREGSLEHVKVTLDLQQFVHPDGGHVVILINDCDFNSVREWAEANCIKWRMGVYHADIGFSHLVFAWGNDKILDIE